MLARTQRLIEMVYRIQAQSRASYGSSRGAAGAAVRVLDPLVPITWEFGGFSQHGEDGIIDHLCSQMLAPNRFFFEIVERRGGYSGFGAPNAPVRTAAQRRLMPPPGLPRA